MMDFWPILLLIVLSVMLLAIKFKQEKLPADDGPWPYQARRILTEREQVLYHRLREALPELLIFSQVQLSQIIMIKNRAEKPKMWLNKINLESADFVVCAPDTSVLAVIELVEKSHKNTEQTIRNATKAKALKDAGIKFIRVREIPSVSSVCNTFGRSVPVVATTSH